LALAANGARATSSGSLAGYRIHELDGINDGRYGNGHCWIADRREGAWVQIELPEPATIKKLVWSRDRDGKFVDRLATNYVIEVAIERGKWKAVASSEDRKPPGSAPLRGGLSPVIRQFVNGFAPVSTTVSVEAERSSSEYTIDSWQTPDGLPANTVTAIAQTPDGYLWLGTLNGLARFDGIRFRTFNKSDGLPNARVQCLLVDHNGQLWIGTDGGGLARFDHGRFTVLTRKEGLRHDVVLTLAEDDQHRLWVGTARGLSCLRNGRFETSGALVPKIGLPISRIVFQTNRMWVAERGGVFIVRNGEMDRPDIPGEPSWFSSIFALHRGSSGRIWFGGANNYLGCLSNETVSVYPEQPGQLLGSIWELLETRSGDVWVGTDSGGLRRLRDGRFSSITTQEGLSDNSIRCLFEDREANLWVGTIGGGLNRIKPKRLTTFTTRQGLSHNVVMSLAERDDGTLWIGSHCGGLSTLRDGQVAPYTGSGQLENECIWSVVAVPQGPLWIGSWGGGLFRLRGSELVNVPLSTNEQDLSIVSMCDDHQGGLWIGTYSAGLKHLTQQGLVSITTSNGLSADFVTAIVQDPSGALWVGTGGGGINRLDCTSPGDMNHAAKPASFTRSHGLPHEFIRTLFVDSMGTLWAGTDGGLARFSNGQFEAFTQAEGLPDEVISQILEDDRGFLWLGSNRGILAVSKTELDRVAAKQTRTINVITFGRAEGMESAQCTGGFHPAGLRSRDGRLWFSTVRGLVMVDPSHIQQDTVAPTVLIDEVRVEGHAVEAIESLRRLPYRTGRVEFQFTATSLVAPERNRFRHRLEGLEREWVEDGLERSVAYHLLPPGRYRFQVAACNADGVWNSLGASIDLRIVPPFWRTWWFGSILGLAVLGGGGSTVRYWSVRRLRRRLFDLEQQHALEKERSRIARDIHDELGANLTRITLLTELGQKHQERPEEVAADLGKISATAREAVRAMDAIVWAVNPRNDSLDSFANYISQFTEEFLRLTPIRCRLDVPADLPEQPLSTEMRHHLFLAVKETVNNVVRHSGASELRLAIECNHGALVITIEDNGNGLATETNGHGHDGLNNIRARVESLGGKFLLWSEAEKGTRVQFLIDVTHQQRMTT